MEAEIKQEITEIKEAINKAEARLDKHEKANNLDMAMKVQEELNTQMRRLEEKERQGES